MSLSVTAMDDGVDGAMDRLSAGVDDGWRGVDKITASAASGVWFVVSHS